VLKITRASVAKPADHFETLCNVFQVVGDLIVIPVKVSIKIDCRDLAMKLNRSCQVSKMLMMSIIILTNESLEVVTSSALSKPTQIAQFMVFRSACSRTFSNTLLLKLSTRPLKLFKNCMFITRRSRAWQSVYKCDANIRERTSNACVMSVLILDMVVKCRV